MGSDIINEIKGLVEKITYKNAENGFYVIKIRVKGSKDLITSTGYLHGINISSVVTLYGEWKNDKNYGRQFSVKKYDETLPATLYGIEKYLGSGLIKGIGISYAKKIVSHFKEQTLDIIENYPEKLSEIEGIDSKLIAKIKASWEEHKFIKELAKFLQELDINTYYTTKIYKEYGNESIKKIKENPYCLSDDIDGLGFKTSDSAARKFDKDTESYLRCRSGIIHILNMESNKGHCYLNFFDLASKASKKLDIDEGKIIITEDDMIFKKELIGDKKDIKDNKNNIKTRVYLPEFYYSEKGIAKLIKIIMNTKERKKIIYKDTSNSIEYDEIQKRSMRFAINTKFMILTGGPGTGKTTTIKGIIDCLKQNDIKIILTAPTGRAAKRITETTGLEAKTIHRLLEIGKFDEDKFDNIDTDVAPVDADILVIDEMSMVDTFIMNYLIKAIYLGTKLIFVGDPNQLPSVGPGSILKDLIDSNQFATVHLDKIFRQAAKSKIIVNAHNVNNGINFVGKKDYIEDSLEDFFYINESNQDKMLYQVLSLSKERLKKYGDYEFFTSIQVLTPTKKGKMGTKELNQKLQAELNPFNEELAEKSYGEVIFREGDRIMQINNNYDIYWEKGSRDDLRTYEAGTGVFNGEIGRIVKINHNEKQIQIEFDDKKIAWYAFSELDQLEHAYAITIHKAQGSEFDVVILVIPQSSNMLLTRNLLYTGLTRAKKMLIVIGNKSLIEFMINNCDTKKRNTGLKLKLISK